MITTQEAINYLRDPTCAGAGLSTKEKLKLHEEAVDMAVEALEKQIPMRPVQDTKPRDGMGHTYYDWVCPTCGTFLAFEPARIEPHHCKCGQALYWGRGR